MPPNPPNKAHGFAMRSMWLHDMQISKTEIKQFLAPPPAKSWGRPCIIIAVRLSCILSGSNNYVIGIAIISKIPQSALLVKCGKSQEMINFVLNHATTLIRVSILKFFVY